MALKLFWLFLKINLLTVSGPASLGLTKQLVVPGLLPEVDFTAMATVASGIPGSDAVQMALQVGYKLGGIGGAAAAVAGALVPSILLVSLVLMGMRFVPTATLSAFFRGATPALAVLLVLTAWQLFPDGANWLVFALAVLAAGLLALHVPVIAVLLLCGFLGIVSGG